MIDKLLFLEYKFRDFSDEEIISAAPTGIIANYSRLNSLRVQQIRNIGLSFQISFTPFPKDVCPAAKGIDEYLINKLDSITSLKPEIIWFDHLRFDGNWEMINVNIPMLHHNCRYCEMLDRVDYITQLSRKIRKIVPKDIRIGYFAVPFKLGEYNNWENKIGQDHVSLGNIYDYISPMLYHRMIKKRVEYIGEYLNYLDKIGVKAEIIPIIQLKDMPDELEDELKMSEIGRAIKESLTNPSRGVAVFSWDQAIEKNKLKAVSEILNLVN